MQKTITKIAPYKTIMPKQKRVAAYARVSSDKDTMLHSLATQISYYKTKIENNTAWQFAGVYADEAITGTTEERPDLLRLLSDCRAGKIDMVITKAISRFARNTVTTLTYVRELRELGISIYFEQENIDTLSGDGELILTVLSSFAQEQSRAVSENCKWRIRKDFEKGIAQRLNYLFGYDIAADGTLTVNPEQSEIVKMIFDDYLARMGTNAIRKKLNDMGVPTACGNLWRETTVRKMLKNERYIGDTILQKTFVRDHISKKKTINRGQLNQYYFEDSHPPIISRAVFLAVQEEFSRRAEQYTSHARQAKEEYEFTGKIVCAGCGKNFRRRTMNANNKWRKVFWQCGTYLRLGKDTCLARQIPEQALMNITKEFDKPIERILAEYPTALTFTFTDGSQIKYEWSEKDEYTDANPS